MIVFLLRHADRTTTADDLSAAGKRRADLLARMLAESGVSVAFRSQFTRAAKTLQPLKAKLAAALDVREMRVEAADQAGDYAKKIAAAVRALPAKTVTAIVGHSDTIGPTIAALGGGQIDPIGEKEFDRLFVLHIAASGAPSLLKLRY